MMPIYCLTLRQTPERKAIAADHFASRGVDVTFFEGIHGATWKIGTEKWFQTRRDDGNGCLPPGHVGLNLSHWMLWSHLWHAGIEVAVIVEDDVILPANFSEQFEREQKSSPPDWQFWYLGTVGKPSTIVHGTHAYVVRRSALPILLDDMQSCQDHVDIQLSKILQKLRWHASNFVNQRTVTGEWQGCCHQDYIAPTGNRIGAIAASQKMNGWCCKEKAGKLYDAIDELGKRFSEPLRCVELGVWGGMSLIPVALALKRIGRGHITGIDPYTKAAAIEGLCDEGHEGDHKRAWSTGPEPFFKARQEAIDAIRANHLGEFCGVLTAMPDTVQSGFDRLHYLHVDDSHSTTTSVRNVSAWMPKLIPGGLLVLDDCCWPTVQPARAIIRDALTIRPDLSDSSEGLRWEVYQKTVN